MKRFIQTFLPLILASDLATAASSLESFEGEYTLVSVEKRECPATIRIQLVPCYSKYEGESCELGVLIRDGKGGLVAHAARVNLPKLNQERRSAMNGALLGSFQLETSLESGELYRLEEEYDFVRWSPGGTRFSLLMIRDELRAKLSGNQLSFEQSRTNKHAPEQNFQRSCEYMKL